MHSIWIKSKQAICMSFENTDFREESLELSSPYDIKLVNKFLQENGFDYEPRQVDYTMILYNLNGDIIGTGSYQGQIIKYLVIAPKYREGAALAQIITHLSDIILKNNKNVFIFTKPENTRAFEGVGFKTIASVKDYFAVLEMGYKSINDYVAYLKRMKRSTKTDKIASIVMNCNPFTNGHRYLIEKASEENELVYLFVVEEEKSAFPFEVRWQLIKEGIEDLKNVIMIKGGQYIVSSATFPSYFLKNKDSNKVIEKQAELDLTIFSKYFVPILGIKRRYVGSETYCHTTATYNRIMGTFKEYFTQKIIVRKKIGENKDGTPNYISASKVRAAIINNDLMPIIEFLPESTKRYLLSNSSWSVRQRIKKGSRH